MKITLAQGICGILTLIHILIGGLIVPFSMVMLDIMPEKGTWAIFLLITYVVGIFLPSIFVLFFEKKNCVFKAQICAFSPLIFVAFFGYLFLDYSGSFKALLN